MDKRRTRTNFICARTTFICALYIGGPLKYKDGAGVRVRGVVAPPRKLFPDWTNVSLKTTHDWRIKFKRANEKHSSEQVLHFLDFVRMT